MKKIEVKVTKFEAKDGSIFDTEDECFHHEKLLSGERIVCPSCNGTKVMPDGFGVKDVECGRCKGKGWLEKKVIMSSYKQGGYDRKYIISKVSGKPVDFDADYFVLRLDEDPHARKAMAMYSASVGEDNIELANDIDKRLEEKYGFKENELGFNYLPALMTKLNRYRQKYDIDIKCRSQFVIFVMTKDIFQNEICSVCGNSLEEVLIELFEILDRKEYK